MTFRQFVRFKIKSDLLLMGFLKNIFKTEPKEEKVLPWIPLTTVAQLNLIAKKSSVKPQILFKHSTRCGISSMVINQFIDAYSFDEADFDLYYLDILNNKDLSNEVGYKFQVMHESPQLLIIKNSNVVVHASHGVINSIELQDYL